MDKNLYAPHPSQPGPPQSAFPVRDPRPVNRRLPDPGAGGENLGHFRDPLCIRSCQNAGNNSNKIVDRIMIARKATAKRQNDPKCIYMLRKGRCWQKEHKRSG